ncbi:MAG: hypothetical protein KF841_08200 [Phycisphaerae bacterium]|nr:hypothetical protein [Phycisphaerae bacterium]
MNQESKHSGSMPQPGRFVVRFRGATQQYLAAHEVLELLDQDAQAVQEIFRVHRAYPDGRLDLVGVAPVTFSDVDGILLLCETTLQARADYDALIAAAGRSPPPCRVEVRFAHTPHFDAPHVVALAFSAACGEGVAQWLAAVDFDSRSRVEASPSHRRRFESAVSQVILSTTLEPSGVGGA